MSGSNLRMILQKVDTNTDASMPLTQYINLKNALSTIE